MVTYLPSQATTTIQITTLEVGTTLTIGAPVEATQGELFTVTGLLTRNDNGAGLPGETIDLRYNGTGLGSIQTAGDGSYTVSVSIDEVGSFTLTAEFAGSVRSGLTFNPSRASVQVGAMAIPLNIIVPAIAIVTIGTLLLLGRKK